MSQRTPVSINAAVGRIGGLHLHATHDSAAIAANARRGLDAKFIREVQERAAAQGETLAEAEVARRAALARREHFARLSLRSAQKRRKAVGA